MNYLTISLLLSVCACTPVMYVEDMPNMYLELPKMFCPAKAEKWADCKVIYPE